MAAIGQQARPATGSSIRTPLFIFGVALALLAFLLMFAFGIVYVGRTSAGSDVRVLVATRDIQPREPMTADMVTLSSIPSSAVPPHAFLRVSDVNGLAATVEIFKGQAISSNLVASTDQLGDSPSSFLPIPAGYVAITIPASEQIAVAGYPAPGDYIDVIASVNTGAFSPVNPRSVTKTVFSKLYIIRVGPQTVVPRQGQTQGVASSITVVMTECDAQYMVWLQQNTTLKYSLVSYHDYTAASPSPDPSCPSSTTSYELIGPAQVDARWGFSKA